MADNAPGITAVELDWADGIDLLVDNPGSPVAVPFDPELTPIMVQIARSRLPRGLRLHKRLVGSTLYLWAESDET